MYAEEIVFLSTQFFKDAHGTVIELFGLKSIL